MFIEREKPSDFNARQQIGAARIVFFHLIEVIAAPVLRERLRKFKADKKIDEPLVAAMHVADKFGERKTIAQPVVAFLVFFGEFRHILLVNFNANLVLEQSATNRHHEAGVGIGSKQMKDAPRLE